MKTIIVIRHGQTEWNVARRMQGRLDSPLTAEGVRQAHAHGAVLKKLDPVEEMYVSPSGRTRETAYILNSYVRAPMIYEDALLERDMGAWSGLSVDDLETAFPSAWQERLQDPYHHRPPDGENLADMRRRCEAFLQDVVDNEARTVALVTHQVMSRVIVGALLGLTEEETVQVIHPNKAFYRLTVSEEAANSDHFLAGEGPFEGLLSRGDDGTISGRS